MPVITRSSTGITKRPNYNYGFLRLRGEAVNEDEASSIQPAQKRRKNPRASSGRGKAKIANPNPQPTDKGKRKAKDKAQPGMSLLDFDPKAVAAELRKDQQQSIPPLPDVCQGVTFIPPVSFGERMKEGLSRLELLDIDIDKWEKVKEAHHQHLPSAVPMIAETLRKLREKRTMMARDPANSRPMGEDAAEKLIAERIEILRKTLQEAEFEPEKENIRGAIEAYLSGEIGYTSQYTLIWKGKVVDRADTYADFICDRQRRLDQYARDYGNHWLWWERGLKIHPNDAPRQSNCVALNRQISVTGLGQYYVKQAYWKRVGWVARMPSLIGVSQGPVPHEDGQQFFTTPEGLAYCQVEGPKLVFESLLDSGATYPTLHPSDFPALGINRLAYAAQSVESFVTANGKISARIYEMFVTVLDEHGRQAVSETDPSWPAPFGQYLGGLCPVAECVGVDETPGEQGIVDNHRLSGLLPFLACYLSYTPTTNTLFLGEDRNDVLGLNKIPGQRRWDISLPSDISNFRFKDNLFDAPKIRFTHRGGQITDIDSIDQTHNSTWTFGVPPNHLELQGHPMKADAAAKANAAFVAALEALAEPI